MLKITPLICEIGVQSGGHGQFSRHVTTAVIRKRETKRSTRRVVANGETKEKAKEYFPHVQEKYRCQIEAYKVMPDKELVRSCEVRCISFPRTCRGDR